MTRAAISDLINELRSRYPNIQFLEHKTFMWQPEENAIYFDPNRIGSKQGHWSLLHEIGHALARHTHFETDLELIKLEMQAWRFARQVAASLKMKIDENHIEDCLDTYRDWLHQRSRCPDCSQINPQSEARRYACFNCRTTWKVSGSQLCSARSRT